MCHTCNSYLTSFINDVFYLRRMETTIATPMHDFAELSEETPAVQTSLRETESEDRTSRADYSLGSALIPLIVFRNTFRLFTRTLTITAATPALRTVYSTTASKTFVIGSCTPVRFSYPICQS